MPTLTEKRDDLMSRADVAKWLDISEWQVRNLERHGELPVIRLGTRTVKYKRADVLAFIERRRVEGGEA